MRARLLTSAIAIGAVATALTASLVVASAATSPTGAKACVTKSGALTLLSHKKCARHTSKITLGAALPAGTDSAIITATDGGSASVVPGASALLILKLAVKPGNYVVTVTGSVFNEAPGVSPTGVSGRCEVDDSKGRVLGRGTALSYFDTLQPPYTVAGFQPSPTVPFSIVTTATSPKVVELKCLADPKFQSTPSSDPFNAIATIVAQRVTSIQNKLPVAG